MLSEAHRSASLKNLKKANAANAKRYALLERAYVICAKCGKTAYCKPREVKLKRYCSKACEREDYRTRMRGSSNPNFRDAGKRTCEECEQEYRSYIKTRKFCSHQCAAKSNILRLRSYAKDQRKDRFCADCSKHLLKHRKYCEECLAKRWPGKFCEMCGKRAPLLRGQRYCSRECRERTFITRISFCSVCGKVERVKDRKYCDKCWRARMARSRKVDDNHHEIVDALRKAGCGVLDLSQVGGGVPDLCVARAGVIYMIEIKNPKARGKLNPLQKQWHARFSAQAPIAVVYSVEEALRVVGLLAA